MKRRTIFLARHGETAWNAEGRLQGGTDIPLNERGRAQAKELAALLRGAGVSLVMSSNLGRAHETAQIVAEELGLDEERRAPLVDLGLQERRFGIFEGLTPAECELRYRAEWRLWKEQLTPPSGAEATDGVMARFGRAMENAGRIADEMGPVLVVSHGGAMRIWLRTTLKRTFGPIANGEVYEVSLADPIAATPWPPGSSRV